MFAPVQYLIKDTPNLTRGLTSHFVCPALGDFLLDSTYPSCPATTSTVVLAKLSPSLLETLADIQLLYSVIAVHRPPSTRGFCLGNTAQVKISCPKSVQLFVSGMIGDPPAKPLLWFSNVDNI